ncbi:MAG: outer membrane beta-barrel protein [Janthinobacterium lividum]
MKRLTTCLLSAALLAGATAASAQTTYRLGLRGGLNRALTTLDGTNYSYYAQIGSVDKSAVYAWQAGAVAEVNFGKLAFQPALVFSQKGEKYHSVAFFGDFGVTVVDQTGVNRYNWLELPLNVVYTLHGDHGLQVFAGPYVALAVGGRQHSTIVRSDYFNPSAPITTEVVNTTITYGADTDNRRLDAGLNFGVGYRQGPLQVQLGYGLGLRNLHEANEAYALSAGDAYNRAAQLTATYFFKL